ncbi:hypothetical protein ACLMJK_009631 [Lecanora helva]
MRQQVFQAPQATDGACLIDLLDLEDVKRAAEGSLHPQNISAAVEKAYYPGCERGMLHVNFLLFVIFLSKAIASLLPVKVPPAISSNAYSIRSGSYSNTVVNPSIDGASIDSQRATGTLGRNLQSPTPTPMSPFIGHMLRPQATDGQVSNSAIAVTMNSNDDGIHLDHYNQYMGDGSIAAGWPAKESWISFPDMFNNSKYFFERSCMLYNQEPNSEEETTAVYNAIQSVAEKTMVDHRYILAIIMQESGGCVRAPTSNFGVPNSGIMQDHNGTATCNNADAGGPQNPCPAEIIEQMVQDGTGGTDWGDGLAQCINIAGTDDVSAFYRAARIYNSGSIDVSGNLEAGIATHCYASDVANRLTGWVTSEDVCALDG